MPDAGLVPAMKVHGNTMWQGCCGKCIVTTLSWRHSAYFRPLSQSPKFRYAEPTSTPKRSPDPFTPFWRTLSMSMSTMHWTIQQPKPRVGVPVRFHSAAHVIGGGRCLDAFSVALIQESDDKGWYTSRLQLQLASLQLAFSAEPGACYI